MKAIVIERPGGPDVLAYNEVPTPAPKAGEVRVRVHAAGVNRADLLQRMGLYPAPPDSPQQIPGLELAGEIDAIGQGVTVWKTGDRVFGLVGGGAYAEEVITHADCLARIPDSLSYIDAAAIPEAFITAWDAMVSQAQLAAGETVLVHAAGSGVGTAAIQIARALSARALGTARSAGKLARAQKLGMDRGFVVDKGAFADDVLRATGGRGVDVILDLVGGHYLVDDLAAAATRARIVLVGLLGGPSAELELRLLLHKRLTLFGTTLRARPLGEKIAVTRTFAEKVVPLFAAGTLVPVLDRTLPLSQAADAHRLMASNEGFGKLVLTV